MSANAPRGVGVVDHRLTKLTKLMHVGKRTEWRPTAPHRWSFDGSSDPKMITPTTTCLPVEGSSHATGLPESPAPRYEVDARHMRRRIHVI